MIRDEFTEKVIILKVGLFKEIDCWVRFLSPSRGIVTAFAFGGSKSRRRFPGCLDWLNHVLFSVTSDKHGHYLYLKEGVLLDRFSQLQQNLARLGMAVNCLKFLEAAHKGYLHSKKLYEIFLNSLRILNNVQVEVNESFPLFFRARLASEYGYRPDLLRCALCGKEIEDEEMVLFQLQQGRILCSGCCSGYGIRQKIKGEVLKELDSIFESGPENWRDRPSDFFINSSTLGLLDNFVQYHMGLVWKSNQFQYIR